MYNTMQITQSPIINNSKNQLQNSNNNTTQILNHRKSLNKQISFGVDPITLILSQQVSKSAARGIFGMFKVRKILEQANDLFLQYDKKPAIETAIAIDSKLETSFLHDTSNLLNMAIENVKKLPDDYQVNRDLKYKVLEYCYVDKKNFVNSENLESLFAGLDNHYHNGFIKHLLTRLSTLDSSSGELGLSKIKNLDSVLNNLNDNTFKVQILKAEEKQKLQYAEYNRERDEASSRAEDFGDSFFRSP